MSKTDFPEAVVSGTIFPSCISACCQVSEERNDLFQASVLTLASFACRWPFGSLERQRTMTRQGGTMNEMLAL